MPVTLRPVVVADGERLFAWRNSPAVSAYMYTDHLISPDEHERWLAGALAASDRRYWMIEADGAPVGMANILGLGQACRRCEWGYYLGELDARGRGVGSAAKFIVIDHVFARLGQHKLWSEVLLENEVGWKSDEAFGFVREACYRDHVWKAGRFHDVLGLGLLAEDWARSRAACAERLRAKGYGPSDLNIVSEGRP